VNRPAHELADIISKHKQAFFRKHVVLQHHQKVLLDIEKCRTAYFGGHIDQCSLCSHLRISYNSCRNRHCPKCQSTNRERWIEEREKDLLPVTYFHVVFTLPHELNSYCLHYPKEMYDTLFLASKETMEVFARDKKHLGAKPGIISILHTWGQNLSLHPHIHMIVAGGGITEEGYWKNARSKGNYLFPTQAMATVYKNKFMQYFLCLLKKHNQPIDKALRESLYTKPWIVYAKQPFRGPKQVIEYLGRYTHKIAISNHRIKNVSDGNVSFTYKDYADSAKQKTMTLSTDEFLRRFCMHILPTKFRKIRHYGFLASRNKPVFRKYQFMQGMVIKPEKKDWKQISKEKLGYDADACPCCKTGKMIRIMSFDTNPPPEMIKRIQQQRKTIYNTIKNES
jgi:hypothetical protein